MLKFLQFKKPKIFQKIVCSIQKHTYTVSQNYSHKLILQDITHQENIFSFLSKTIKIVLILNGFSKRRTV